MTKTEAIAHGHRIIRRLDELREDPLAKTLTITVEEIYIHQLIGLAEGLAMSGQPELMHTLCETIEGLSITPIPSKPNHENHD